VADKQAVEDAISRARETGEGTPGSADSGNSGPGSPRGKWKRTAEARKRTSEASKAAWRKRKGESATPPPEPLPISPMEIEAYGLLGATLWKLVGRMVGLRPLHEQPLPGEEVSEKHQLGAALAPLGRKYVPALDRWAEEINAVVVIAVLYDRTRIPKEKKEAEHDGMESSGVARES